uniref:WAC domain-containing protein n=1 Tax=Gongylonema pulchrum TaxID=637853 RepID=A0A183EWY2_9BILA
LAFYDRSMLLMKEAEKEKNYKKSEMYTTMKEGKRRVEQRMKDLKKQKKAGKSEVKKQEQDSTTSEIKEELKKQIEAAGTVEADLIYYIPEGVQLFMIEVSDVMLFSEDFHNFDSYLKNLNLS